MERRQRHWRCRVGNEGRTRGRRGRRRGIRRGERMWPEPWGLAKSPSLSASPAPPSTQPLTGCPSPHNGCLSAEISRYWIPGLKFCPVTMSRQRSMLQGRHTLQVKSWKTIPPFISIKKGRTPPPHTLTHTHSSFFQSFVFFNISPVYQTRGKLFLIYHQMLRVLYSFI